MQNTRYPSQNPEENVNPEISMAIALHEHGNRRHEDSEEIEADIIV